MKTLDTDVVGMQHRLTPSTRRMLKSHIAKDGPVEVLLIREHDNDHDENAIKVQVRRGAYKGLHIGYVPRAIAAVYAPALDKSQVRVRESVVTDVDVENGTGSLHIKVSKPGKSKRRDFKKSRKGA